MSHKVVLVKDGEAEDLSHLTDEELAQRVKDATTDPAETPPEVPRMSLNDARVLIAKQLNEVLQNSVTAVREALAVDPNRDTSAEAHNGKMMMMAAMDFIQGDKLLIRKFDRPTLTASSGMVVPLRNRKRH